MNPAALTILNSSVLGVVVLLMIFGYLVPKPSVDKLEAQIKWLREDRDLQRQRADEVASTGTVTNQLISALVNQKHDPVIPVQAPGRDPAGTWKDLA